MHKRVRLHSHSRDVFALDTFLVETMEETSSRLSFKHSRASLSISF